MHTPKLSMTLILTSFAIVCIANKQIVHSPGLFTIKVSPGDEIRTYKNAAGTNVIKWAAGKEQALEFLLQGSTDGKNFRAIKRIIAVSSAIGTSDYEATDEGNKGYIYFRIIRIYNSGLFSYSRAVSAHDQP